MSGTGSFHLTHIDNTPNDFSIQQGANYTLPVIVGGGDRTTWTAEGEIRSNYLDSSGAVLATFSFLTPTYNGGTDQTTFTATLTAADTKAIPSLPLARREKTKDPVIVGSNVWVYDIFITNPGDTETIRATGGYVEVCARSTNN